MRWERFQRQEGLADSSSGPGKRWGHTCNAVKEGRFVYVFGGYGGDDCLTNQVHVFDVERQIWSEPVIRGVPPSPRDGHSCTTVGDNLFVFGGTDGKHYLDDLHVLDTSSHTWKCIEVRGEGPDAREAHSAQFVGRFILIFGGCGKVPGLDDEVFYNDLYVLCTEAITWRRATTTGMRPFARHGHTFSFWNKKLIVVGGEDFHGNYLSDVHILDAETFAWKQLKTSGQVLTPRAGHVTFINKGGILRAGDVAAAVKIHLCVFGGFAGSQTLYNDLYVLDLETCVWSKIAMGEGPSARFSAAAVCLDPYMPGSFFLFGGCNKDLDPLDDIYYLHRDRVYQARVAQTLERRERIKLKIKELKLAMEQGRLLFQARVTESSPLGYAIEAIIGRRVLRGVLFSNRHHTTEDPSSSSRQGTQVVQAKVTESSPLGFTIETTTIDGKVLRGVLLANRHNSSVQTEDPSSSSSQQADPIDSPVDAKAGPGGDSSPGKQDEGRVAAEDANAEQ